MSDAKKISDLLESLNNEAGSHLRAISTILGIIDDEAKDADDAIHEVRRFIMDYIFVYLGYDTP